jgi:tol-pal system protein YbgF
MRRLLCGLILVAFTSGCATTGGPFAAADSPLRTEVEELKRRVLELQRKAAVSEVEIARLRERLIELELLGEQSATRAPVPSPRAVEERTLIEPPRVLRIEDISDRDLEASAPIAQAAEDPPQPSPNAKSGERGVLEDGGSLVAAVEGVVDAGQPTPPAGEAIYDRGYTLYNQGQFVEAEASFQRFLQEYGATELADNALYWIGEARFSRRDFRGALAAFRETAHRYPHGNKIPDALLKAGRSLEELGDTAAARESYRELQRRFPDSALALVAAERIRELR